MNNHEPQRPRTPKRQISTERESWQERGKIGGNSLGGNGLDRFIPQQTSRRAYRSSPSLKKFDVRESELADKSPSPERLSSPEFFSNLRSTGHYEAINRDPPEESDTTTPDTTVSVPSHNLSSSSVRLSFEQKRHREFIADCLGFQSPQRVLRFHSSHAGTRKNSFDSDDKPHGEFSRNHTLAMMNQHHHYLRVDAMASALPPSKAIHYLGTTAFSKMNQSLSFVSHDDSARPAKRVKSQVPYRVLDAPSLRNDFYSNLISWSNTTDNIMVGLGCSVYIWSDSLGAVPVLSHDYLGAKNDLVTCVSFCPRTNHFVVGTKQGRILLFDQQLCLEKYQNENCVLKPLYEYQTDTLRGISCIEWSQKSTVSKFLVGEESGTVFCLAISDASSQSPISPRKHSKDASLLDEDKWLSRGFSQQLYNNNSLAQSRETSYFLECVFKFQAQSQQVCGISLREDDELIAIGGNDNSCTLWDISLIRSPKLRFILPHGAAVKAVTFCPWSKSLLATGAGSKDRKIRFWHTKTGTLLDEIQTDGQITSLIWSTRYKQIVATFGFGDVEDPILVTLYSYPKLIALRQVRSPTPLRILSAVSSPNMTSICVAANDETIRFYELWSEKEDVISEAQESGIYGSNIIDYVEGINGSHFETIR